jgi:DNA helicase-2/ATP-dependent DNA helicase PcrA
MSPSDAQLADILADLNEPQRRAVVHRDGPLLVIAGPGSGKTRVITRRAAYLVRSGISARNILAITFTNKAADEMRRRIDALGVSSGMWVYTFHALCARLLHEFGALAGVQPGFSIYDEADSGRVIREALATAGVNERMFAPDQLRGWISDAKSRLETPEELAAQADWSEDRLRARVYQLYQELLEQRNALDFDDLLMRVALVLRAHPDVTERLNIRFRYVLIDEYQDTNHVQYVIASLLSSRHGNICATGDPDQSIYAWRGADIRNILEFERDFPNAVVVRLEQNYRSTGRILHVADRLIARNRRRKHKDLWTENPAGPPVHVWQFAEGADEAERIAQTIYELHASGRPWSDCAIFYRINALSRGFEEALHGRGIPYRIARGVEFYNRKEIRDVLAYLRILINPADSVALLRIINVPARGIGKTTVERLQTYANESGRPLLATVYASAEIPALHGAAKRLREFAALLDRLKPVVKLRASEAVNTVLAETGLEAVLREERDSGGEDRLANVQELVTAALRYEQTAEDPAIVGFLQHVSLVSDQDAVDEQAGCVNLMTLHAAKGLEFPVVFLVGFEQGMLPHERALSMHGDVEEERRLCFVGITRARGQLFLSRADERLIRGQRTPRSPSQFLQELDDGDLCWEDLRPPALGIRPTVEGFVPLVEDLPPEEASRLVPKRRFRADDSPGEDDESMSTLRRRPQPPAADSTTGWKPGMLVQHERYGVGQILWVRPSPDYTRAGVKFAGYGEKTLVLEVAPIRKLERRT